MNIICWKKANADCSHKQLQGVIWKKIKIKALFCPVFQAEWVFSHPGNLQTPKALHQIGFTHLLFKFPHGRLLGWLPRALQNRDLWHLRCLHSATCPNPTQSWTPGPSSRAGTGAIWQHCSLNGQKPSKYVFNRVMKIKKVQGPSFWKTHSSSTSKGSLICCWSHDQSGAKRVKRGERIKSNLQSCGKQVTYGPSEADHETSPECKYYLICLANVRNPSEHILQVRNSSPFFPLLSFLCPWTLYPLKSQVTIHVNKVLRCLTKKIGSADFST